MHDVFTPATPLKRSWSSGVVERLSWEAKQAVVWSSSPVSLSDRVQRDLSSALTDRLQTIRSAFADQASSRIDSVLTVAAERFIDTIATLLRRLAADADAIWQAGLVTGRDVDITELDVERMPTHADDTLVRITFASGSALLYRSSNGAAIAAFNGLIEWLGNTNPMCALRVLRTFTRDEYCWTEYPPCPSDPYPRDVPKFFERAGIIAFVQVLLNGIYASSPRAVAGSGAEPLVAALDFQFDYGHSRDATECLNSPVPWLSGRDSVVDTEGHRHTASEQARNIEDGFVIAYRTVLDHRAQLMTSDGPLAPFRSLRAVAQLRSRADYVLMQRRLDGEAIDAPHEDKVWREPSMAQIAGAERMQLDRRDIPRFFANASSVVLDDGHGVKGRAETVRSAAGQLADRLAALSAENLELQRLRHRFRIASLAAADHRMQRSDEDAAHRTGADLDAEAIAEAVLIGDELREVSTMSASGEVVWLNIARTAPRSRFVLRPIDVTLFQGTAGVALFFSVLASVRGRDEDRMTVRGCINAIAGAVADDNGRSMAAGLGMHGVRGVAGVAYALSWVGKLTGEKSASALAATLTANLLEAPIDSVSHADVLLGVAGTLLILLALYRHTTDDRLVDRATELGKHLLKLRARDPNTGLWVWQTTASPQQPFPFGTGFAHGSSGIGFALGSLYKVTGQAVLLEAVDEARSFENRLFLPEANNWLDESTRDPASPANRYLMRAWCHGVGGIYLARVGLASIMEMECSPVDAALGKLWRNERKPVDQLCCGRIGGLEVLLSAGSRLGRPDLAEAARAVAGDVLKEARKSGGYAPSRTPWILMPGLFHGPAGIGYEMLRLVFPERFPNILLLE